MKFNPSPLNSELSLLQADQAPSTGSQWRTRHRSTSASTSRPSRPSQSFHRVSAIRRLHLSCSSAWSTERTDISATILNGFWKCLS